MGRWHIANYFLIGYGITDRKRGGEGSKHVIFSHFFGKEGKRERDGGVVFDGGWRLKALKYFLF